VAVKADGPTGGGGPAGFPADDFGAFHAELSSARIRLSEAMAGIERPAPPVEADLAARMRAGEPLLSLGGRLPGAASLEEAAREVLRIAAAHEVLEENEADAVIGALGGSGIEDLVSAVATGAADQVISLGRQRGLAADTLLFLGEHLARAVLKWHAESFAGVGETDIVSPRGSCPVCGNQPRFSMLGKDEGTRRLLCGMCETAWRFKRIGCPFCGNEEQSGLRYFFVDGDETSYKVEVCTACKRYLKQVDLRKLAGESVTPVDLDVASARLDLLARREGYR